MRQRCSTVAIVLLLVGIVIWLFAQTPGGKVITAFLSPISFYGKVIDQYGDPVPGAEVKLSANDHPHGKPSEYDLKADADGRFSIKWIHGITLAVWVKKPGYYPLPPAPGKATSSGLFEYGLASTPFRSSKDSPAVLVLYKAGPMEPLVKVGEKNFRVARDGTPLVISLNPAGSSDTQRVILRCWTKDLERPEGQQMYDWRLEINVPAGGLKTRSDDFAFEAPEDGYQPTDVIEKLATQDFSDWDSFAERTYFLKFNDGTFARVDLRMRAGGDHFVVWKSYLNPKPGSRNLEAHPSPEDR